MHFLVFCNICKCKARYIKAQSAAVTTQRSQLRNGLPLDPVVPCFHWSSLWYVTVFFSFLIFLSTVQLILIYILKAVAVLPSPLSSLPTPGLWMGRRQCHTHGPGRCLCRYSQTSSFANDFCIFWENLKIMSFNELNIHFSGCWQIHILFHLHVWHYCTVDTISRMFIYWIKLMFHLRTPLASTSVVAPWSMKCGSWLLLTATWGTVDTRQHKKYKVIYNGWNY